VFRESERAGLLFDTASTAGISFELADPDAFRIFFSSPREAQPLFLLPEHFHCLHSSSCFTISISASASSGSLHSHSARCHQPRSSLYPLTVFVQNDLLLSSQRRLRCSTSDRLDVASDLSIVPSSLVEQFRMDVEH
jgi:hypothetical protein